MQGRLVLLLYLTHWFSHTVGAKYVEGSLRTREQWHFLSRFCFIPGAGTFHYELQYDVSFSVQRLLLYYDTDDQWHAVYRTQKTCAEKLRVLDDRVRHQFINLSAQVSTASGCRVQRRDDSAATLHCTGNRTFFSARERWWFIAIANCDSQHGLSLTRYRFRLTNGRPDNLWLYHFSADEANILPTDVGMLAVQMAVASSALLVAVRLRSRSLLHSTYKLFLAAVLLHLSALTHFCIHYGRYANDGQGYPNVKMAARMWQASAEMIFLLLLLLCAKGYTITRARLRQVSAIRLTVFLCVYVLVWVLLFMHEQVFFDPGMVTYLYESPAGHGLVILRLFGWGMFVYSTAFTIKHYPEKWNFYLPFSTFYTLWFISGPLMILFANYLIDNWVREKVVNAVELIIICSGHVFFLYLTRPTAANTNFPFHVRTSQISVMEQTLSGTAGNNNLDAFSRHTYAPGPHLRTPTELFVVQETAPAPGPGAMDRNKPLVKRDGSFPHRNGTIFA